MRTTPPGETGVDALVPLNAEEIGPKLERPDLSSWFNPFLSRFAQETVGSGGRALVRESGGAVEALVLTDPTERTASVFARSGAWAETMTAATVDAAVYAEAELPRPREVFEIRSAAVAEIPRHRFRYPVQVVQGRTFDRVGPLLREVYGRYSERWPAAAQEAGEACLGVEADGRLVGAAWVLVVGRHARLHSLTVRPEYRRLGIGTDLLFARLLFARQAGAEQAISEISERNVGSRAIAERAGMLPKGRLFLYPRPGPAGGATAEPFAGSVPTTG